MGARIINSHYCLPRFFSTDVTVFIPSFSYSENSQSFIPLSPWIKECSVFIERPHRCHPLLTHPTTHTSLSLSTHLPSTQANLYWVLIICRHWIKWCEKEKSWTWVLPSKSFLSCVGDWSINKYLQWTVLCPLYRVPERAQGGRWGGTFRWLS